ncbi:T9SS type A sorting domain-containing protein, partial [candidate division KSB1 bacterium]|nr:T9SS type A sorting domain-containing protein [candidate division KSB1 bacterium]
KVMKKIREISRDQIRIHVADFNKSRSNYQYISGIAYYANEYLLRNMTRTHHGEYFSILQNGHNGVLYSAFGACNPSFQSFDFSVNPEFGYTYSRYELFKNSGLTLNENFIFQVGKFSGKLPFSLELNGETAGEAFHFNIKIPDSSICQMDTIPQILWGFEKIRDLLNFPNPNNGQIKEILDASIKNRILTPYSAFLALEPNDSVRASKNLFDETKLLSEVQATKLDSIDFDLKFNAYPNPFNSRTVLKISLPAVKSTDTARLTIYNVLGQVVQKFELTHIYQTRRLEVSWDGTDVNQQQVASGNYLAIFTLGNIRKSVRLCYVK